MNIHNVFHVSLLEPCDQPKKGNALPLPPIEVNGKEKFEVKEIFDSWLHYSKLQYLIKWFKDPNMDNKWILEA